MTRPPLTPAASVLAESLVGHVRDAWNRGWQPSDVVRVVRRRGTDHHVSLAVGAISADADRYLGDPLVEPAWLAQLVALGIDIDVNRSVRGRGREWIDEWTRAVPDRFDADDLVMATVLCVSRLPAIPVLMPPPLTSGAGRARARPARPPGTRDLAAADAKMLERIRGLLAKAEATDFEAEAESFTVKAQELMARHSIDHAMVAAAQRASGGGDDIDAPSGRRLPVDDPYAKPKAVLLSVIAGANRCRTAWSREFGVVTVFGYDVDIDMVELLYTSLLVQATSAMVAAGSQRDAYGRSRTRSFRSSFLLSFAYRIGDRLADAAAAAERAADEDALAHGRPSLLPVLADQAERVEAAFTHAFPRLGSFRASPSDAAGWAAGRAAADQAHLGPSASLPA